MTIPDFPTFLQPILSVFAGGIIAIAGSVVQNRLANDREKTKIHLEKLERTYVLCQAVYDGHLREINNAKINWETSVSTRGYLLNRKHPGAEMSELKMLIRCYFPMLVEQIKLLDEGHAKLKQIFIKLDNGARSVEAFSQIRFDQECQDAEKSLEIMGNAANELKRILASTAIKSTQ